MEKVDFVNRWTVLFAVVDLKMKIGGKCDDFGAAFGVLGDLSMQF